MSTGTQTEVVMPQMGVSVSEGTITKWLKQVGDSIQRDEPLLEISSSGSSRPIASPTWRSHFVTVPSETDTPIWGITTSVCVPVDTVPPRRPARLASP